MAFDPMCLEMAVWFLPAGATLRQAEELAQHIQDAAEDWLRANSDPPKQPPKG